MTWNRVQYKTQGRVQADAEDAARWTAATVNGLFAFVYDEGWRRILNADAAYRYTKLTVAPDTDGLVALATIDAALSPNRRYRIFDQRTARDKRLVGPTEVALNPTVLGEYVKYGSTGAGTGSIATWINHLPQNPETLTSDSDAVTWPEGHELVLVYHLAAMLLTKGAVESKASADLFAITDAMYTAMLQAIMDRTTQHQQIVPADNADQWSAGLVW